LYDAVTGRQQRPVQGSTLLRDGVALPTTVSITE
jgi:hypothetical protein